MLKNLIRSGIFVIAATLAAGAGLPVQAQDQAARNPPLKVAFVYVSPIGEAGWTYQHDQGRLAMERALGDRVLTTVVESVPEGADAERVLRDLAAQGNGLIFATSFGYLEAALRVAAEFPQVRFEHAGGYRTSANLNTYNARFYEARYLAGLLAGKTSKRGIAGYVAGFAVPEVVQGINAFALGLLEANPKAELRVLWLNTWFDPAREREAALTLISQGADVLTNHSGSQAVAQAAQEKRVHLIAYQSDMRKHAPDAQLASVTHHWGGYYTARTQAVLDGTWRAMPVWAGMKDGMVQLSALHTKLAPALRNLIEARRKAIEAGTFTPFSAPLVDNQGRLRLDKGALDDAQIAAMDWFVRGVVGSVPRP
ncbi:MAG: BMP family ABC transporter substrate-binding protein [Burkholderiaceae bacterium]